MNPGDRIANKYQVLRRIGEGGMSNIYLVQSLSPPGSPDAGQWVIKEMTVSYRDPDDQRRAVELFVREAELLKQLRHKNLPRVIDIFVVGNRYYTVMEYVEGEDLGKMLLRNPNGFAENKAIQWGIEIATVLYYLHSQKPPIIFRDLKPSNIMISRGAVKLIDFGIARRFDPFKKKDTMRIGSPGYAPPEQYSGQTDRRSDIYSLGVTLHQLVTGRDPSETQTPFKLPSARGIKPSVTASFEAIISQATELDPQKRFKTALDMKRALQAIGGGPISGPLPAMTGPVGSMPLPARPPTPTPAATPSSGTVPPRLAPPAIPSQGPALPPNPYARGGNAPKPPAHPAQIRPPGPPQATATNLPAGAHPTAATAAHPVVPAGTGKVAVMPHNQPLPKGKSSRLPFLFLLIMLGIFGYRYEDDIVRAARAMYRLVKPVATPTPAPTPTPLPTDPLQRALVYLDSTARPTIEAAMEMIDGIRKKDPVNGLALLAYNNGVVLLQARATGAPPVLTHVIQVVYENDAIGNEWLRGVALAQRDINARGGVQGHRILLAPYAIDPLKKMDVDEIMRQKATKSAVTALVSVSQDKLPALTSAYAQLTTPCISSATSDASVAVLQKAIASYVNTDTKATRVAIVASASWPKDGVTAVENDLKAAHPSNFTTHTFTDGGDAIKDIAAAKPELIIFLGDGRALDRFATIAHGAHLTMPIVCGAEALTASSATTALADWMKSGHLFVISSYNPLGAQATSLKFAMAYRRAFGMAQPGFDAAVGFDMLNGLGQYMDNPSAAWTTEGIKAALAVAPDKPASTVSGTTVGATVPGASVAWVALKFQNGVPVVARAVQP